MEATSPELGLTMVILARALSALLFFLESFAVVSWSSYRAQVGQWRVRGRQCATTERRRPPLPVVTYLGLTPATPRYLNRIAFL
jgi:hypothetical protein